MRNKQITRPSELVLLDRTDIRLIQYAATVEDEWDKVLAIATYMLMQAVAHGNGAPQAIDKLKHEAEAGMLGEALSSAVLSMVETLHAIEDGDLR